MIAEEKGQEVLAAIAQALAENLTLISRDGKFGSYAGTSLRTRWGEDAYLL